MESMLNAFYAAMAVYGFWQWRRGSAGRSLPVTRWPLKIHAVAVLGILVLSTLNWLLLRRYTPAAWPFVDSMTAWSSVFATFLVARKVYENWHWWLAIDSVDLYLFFTRHLYVTMLLFALYLVLIVVGMREWRRSMPLAYATG
jgi:nicotinamide mononucleotide transporter